VSSVYIYLYDAVMKNWDCIVIGLMVIGSIMPTIVCHTAVCSVLPAALLTVMLTHLSHLVLQQYFFIITSSEYYLSVFGKFYKKTAFCLIDSLREVVNFDVGGGISICFGDKISTIMSLCC